MVGLSWLNALVLLMGLTFLVCALMVESDDR